MGSRRRRPAASAHGPGHRRGHEDITGAGGNALVPEFAVSNWEKSRDFYVDILGFSLLYERPEEGFCYLALGEAHLMIDQIGVGRDLVVEDAAPERPFGWG